MPFSPVIMGRNSVSPLTIITGLRIDGQDIPNRSDAGKWIWGRANRSLNRIRAEELPPSAIEPGEHTIEFDMVRGILPRGVNTVLPIEDWPSKAVLSKGTVSCTYTVPQEDSEG